MLVPEIEGALIASSHCVVGMLELELARREFESLLWGHEVSWVIFISFLPYFTWKSRRKTK